MQTLPRLRPCQIPRRFMFARKKKLKSLPKFGGASQSMTGLKQSHS
jgi:hypothetical protein